MIEINIDLLELGLGFCENTTSQTSALQKPTANILTFQYSLEICTSACFKDRHYVFSRSTVIIKSNAIIMAYINQQPVLNIKVKLHLNTNISVTHWTDCNCERLCNHWQLLQSNFGEQFITNELWIFNSLSGEIDNSSSEKSCNNSNFWYLIFLQLKTYKLAL